MIRCFAVAMDGLNIIIITQYYRYYSPADRNNIIVDHCHVHCVLLPALTLLLNL